MRWRMELAARRLRTSDTPLASVAADVGYESEFSFSRAFKRSRGMSPGRYRAVSQAAEVPLTFLATVDRGLVGDGRDWRAACIMRL